MQTFYRICIKDFTITDQDGKSFTLKKGQKYLTSAVNRAPAIMQLDPPTKEEQ
jgi:hypothetical protein